MGHKANQSENAGMQCRFVQMVAVPFALKKPKECPFRGSSIKMFLFDNKFQKLASIALMN